MVTDPIARQFKRRLDREAKKGKEWVQHYTAEFASLPHGTWVCIDLQTGEYTIGATDDQAVARFREKHGDRPSWLHGIGVRHRA